MLWPSYHRLINWIGCLIREDTSREARNDFLNVELMAELEDVVVHQHVWPQEAQIVLHVVEQPADFGRQVNDMGRLVSLEKSFCFIEVA